MSWFFSEVRVIDIRKVAQLVMVGLCVSFGVLASNGPTADAADSPTGRRSNDRTADLVDALVDENLYIEAEDVCRRYLDKTQQGSQQQAVWSIRLSGVLAAKLRSEANDDKQAWLAAVEPLEMLRTGYSGEPFAPWLELQAAIVQLARGEVLTMRSMANSSDDPLLRIAEDVVRKATESLRQLETVVEDAAGGEEDTVTEVVRLRGIARQRIIDSLLIRARLYEPDSEDALAAATEAEDAAERLLEVTPFDSANRETVVRTLARARRESQNPKAASELLGPWIQEGRISNPATYAEWILSEMQRGNNDAARQALVQYYGDAPADAPKSVEMDLARLKFLIAELSRGSATGSTAGPNPASISRWVETVGERGGPFAKRLAETEMLRSLRVNPSDGNVTLMVAKAGQLIRSGAAEDLLQGAVLLQQAGEASDAAGQKTQAFQYGLQAAAARAKAGRSEAAADAFAALAQRFPDQSQSPALHFEAARMFAKLAAAANENSSEQVNAEAPPHQAGRAQAGRAQAGRAQAGRAQAGRARAAQLAARIEQLLLAQIRTWPSAQETSSAREWMLRIFEASKRYSDAAQVAASLPPDSILWLDAIAQSGRYWRAAVYATDSSAEKQALGQAGVGRLVGLVKFAGDRAQEGDSAAKSELDIQGTLWDPKVRIAATGEANLLASLVLDRSELAGILGGPSISDANDETDVTQFASDLRRIRIESFDPNRLALDVPKSDDGATILELAIGRLRADGAADEDFRMIAGKAMLRLAEGGGSTDFQRQFAVAVALAWTGDWAEAASRIEAISEATRKDPTSNLRGGEALRQGAVVLGDLPHPLAKRRALELWNRLASGVKPGTDGWHEAKLGAAKLLSALGDKGEAAKLARYVLLTKPPSDAVLRAKYQAFVPPKP